MKVAQLRRLLRTLPPEIRVLLEDLEGIFSAHEDDFEQLELTGQWGPKASVKRKYAREEDLEVKVPTAEAVKASLAGLADYRDALSIANERAIGAEVELEVTLEELAAPEPRIGACWPESPACHCSSSAHRVPSAGRGHLGPERHACSPGSMKVVDTDKQPELHRSEAQRH